MRTRTVLLASRRSFLSLAVLIDRGASEHKRRRREGTRLSRNGKPVTTLRGITWETSDTTRVSTTGRKAENGQDDSSSVGCSRGSFLGLTKAEVRDTDFPSPSQLSVPFAEVETAGSPPVGGVSPRCREQKTQVYHVYPTLGKQNSCCANVHCLGVFFLCLPSSSYRVWRFLCLFAIDVVVLRFSVVTFAALYSVWRRFVSFGFRLGFFALCCANVCPLGIFFIWVCHRCHIAFFRQGMI